MKAILRNIRITPKKANLIAGMVRGKPVNEALATLKFMPKKGAKILYKVIKSAASNAKNNFSQSIDDLVVARVWAVKGITFKRGTPANRGRMWPISELTSHITVEVGLREGATPKKPVAKHVSEPKVEAKAEKAEKKPAKVANVAKETKAESKPAKETKKSK